ncbi:MAG TPA: hypothetical protein DEP36_08925 [Gammaproteobacteria bacterium]|nr:hypothetical protein [Gammaproteobacteria bacterium]
MRIARTGRRFMIERATVWNLTDAAGQRCGQAATFRDWSPMPNAEAKPEPTETASVASTPSVALLGACGHDSALGTTGFTLRFGAEPAPTSIRTSGTNHLRPALLPV